MYEPFDLTETECEELLRGGLVGRVAACTPTGPHVVPVNYSVVEDAVVFRTTPYSVLGSQARGSLLAFEVDQFDYEYQRGWSVVARGRAEMVVDAVGAREHPGDLEPEHLGGRLTHPLPAGALVRAHRPPARP